MSDVCIWASLVDGKREGLAVDLHGGLGRGDPEGAVRPVVVVKAEVGFEAGLRLDLRAVPLQVDLLVFHGAPEPFDEDVVQCPAPAIHRDPHAPSQQRLGKIGRGKLAALIGIEYLRYSMFSHRPGYRLHTEAGIEGVR